MGLRYNAMIQDVQTLYTRLEREAFNMTHHLEARLLDSGHDHEVVISSLEAFTNDFARRVTKEWWALGDMLIAKFSDGYIVTGEAPSEMHCLGYPEWWLRSSEFDLWPHHPLPEWIPRVPTRTPPLPVIPDPDPTRVGSFLPSLAIDMSALAKVAAKTSGSQPMVGRGEEEHSHEEEQQPTSLVAAITATPITPPLDMHTFWKGFGAGLCCAGLVALVAVSILFLTKGRLSRAFSQLEGRHHDPVDC